MKSYTINEINDVLKGEIIGHTTQQITGPEDLKNASSSQITFIGSTKYIKYWETSKACAVILNEGLFLEPKDNCAIIKVKNADLAMAQVLELFNPESPEFEIDIHPTAVIHKSAIIGTGCKIGANCYIGKNVVLGKEVILYPNVCVFDETTIGDSTIIWSGTVIRERCIIGSHCIFHTNVSIGADGFGYRPSDDGRGRTKIPQIGNVFIGNYVEMGANAGLDRDNVSSALN